MISLPYFLPLSCIYVFDLSPTNNDNFGSDRIEPYPDSSLNVEWFRNDKPLPFGNRWRTSSDFGFAALDIIGSYAEDSGRYTLRAKNILGSAESHIDVKISRKKTFLYRLGLPREVRNYWFKPSSKRKVGFRP